VNCIIEQFTSSAWGDFQWRMFIVFYAILHGHTIGSCGKDASLLYGVHQRDICVQHTSSEVTSLFISYSLTVRTARHLPVPLPCIFIHLLVCLTTDPKPLARRAVHIVRSRASYFKWEYPLLSLRSSSSFLRLLPRLPVTSIPPFIFPSITCCRRQFLRKIRTYVA